MVRDSRTGNTESVSASALFVLISAEPHTDWPPVGIQRDKRGFLLSGTDLRCDNPPHGWPLQRAPLPLETSMPGVFAAGISVSVRSSVSASAVGEGSIAATQVSQYLQQHSQ